MGVRTRGVLCLTEHVSSLPLEGCGSERPADSHVCNNGPCENRIEWFTGPWSQVRKSNTWLNGMLSALAKYVKNCLTFKGLFPRLECVIDSICSAIFSVTQCSADCGKGSQQRSVVCLMKSYEGFTVMPPYECSSLERPLSQQSCNLKACGAMWYHTDWSGVSTI